MVALIAAIPCVALLLAQLPKFMWKNIGESDHALKLLVRTDPGLAQGLAELLQEYKADHPHVAIDIMPLYADQWLNEATVSDGGFDSTIDLVIGSAEQGNFLCRKAWVECAVDIPEKEKLDRNLLNLVSENGKHRGHPFIYSDYMMVFYNSAAMQALPGNHLEIISALKEREGILGLSDDPYSNQIFLPLRELATGNKDDSRQHLQAAYRLLDTYLFAANLVPKDCDEACVLQAFKSKKAPLIVAHESHLQQLYQTFGENLGVADVSVLSNASFKPGSAFDGRYIFESRTKKSESAKDLIAFLTSKDNQARVPSILGRVPARIDVAVDQSNHKTLVGVIETVKREIIPKLIQVNGEQLSSIVSVQGGILRSFRAGRYSNRQAAESFYEAIFHESHPTR